MNHSILDIAGALKAARTTKELSQREVSERSGLTQAQISKAESAADLRLTSLVELARALDLEVALIPLKFLPAVQSIVRDSSPRDDARTQPAYTLDGEDVDG